MSFKNYDIDRSQAKPTWYNGTRYRSKLEAKTAQALDILDIPFMYECREFQLSNGMWYKPDFYLTRCEQFIECKGVMDEVDAAKILGLASDQSKPVIALSYDNSMLCMPFWNEGRVTTYHNDEIGLAKCIECGNMWFYSSLDSYRCRCCGAYDGDHLILHKATITTGQDLFEFAQKYAADKPIYTDIAEAFNHFKK